MALDFSFRKDLSAITFRVEIYQSEISDFIQSVAGMTSSQWNYTIETRHWDYIFTNVIAYIWFETVEDAVIFRMNYPDRILKY